MGAVVSGTVMHVMLFVWDVSMLRESHGIAGVDDGGSVVVVSAGHESLGLNVAHVLCLV